MILYIFRHADADTECDVDEDRPLSQKGLGQVKKVAGFCKANDLLPGVILTSPVLRAQQTADLFSRETNLKRVLSLDFLRCGMKPGSAIEELEGYQEFESVMLVGHEPDLSELVGSLIGTPDGSRLKLKKASLTAISISDLAKGEGVLLFSMPVKYMPR